MLEFPRMLAFKEIFVHLRQGFKRRWAYLSAIVLFCILDPAAFVGIIWFFFFSERYPVRPVILEILSGVYLILTGILGIIAFFYGIHRSVKATFMLYASIGIFFFLKGMLDRSGRDFAVWPWGLLWIIILIIILTNFAREQSELNKNPQD